LNEPDDEEIKSLLNPPDTDDYQAIEDGRKGAIARVRFNTAQNDTFAFSLIKIWVALAEALAPIFAMFAKKSVSPKLKIDNKK